MSANSRRTSGTLSTDLGEEQHSFIVSPPLPYGRQVSSPVDIHSDIHTPEPTTHSNVYPNTEERIRKCILTHEIRGIDARRLRKLRDYVIFLICDDSGTMNRCVDGTSTTRWDELKEFTGYVVKFVTLFNPDGIDIRFLNRGPSQIVTGPTEVERLFECPPIGYTPLARVLQDVLRSKNSLSQDQKLLIFIATDGLPTDDEGNPDLPEFEHVMVVERDAENDHVMFLICTDEDEVVRYLRDWDRKMKNVDVTDDYQSQKRAVRKKLGSDYPFGHAEYVVKMLVGAIDSEIDSCDDDPEDTRNGEA